MNKTKAYIHYRGERIEVTVDSIYKGSRGLFANVTAVEGFPFDSDEVYSQGDTSGQYCNGYRLPLRFVEVEAIEMTEEEAESTRIHNWLSDSVTYRTPEQKEAQQVADNFNFDTIDPIAF